MSEEQILRDPWNSTAKELLASAKAFNAGAIKLILTDEKERPIAGMVVVNGSAEAQEIFAAIDRVENEEYPISQLIEALVKGIEAWSADEDGVHPDCYAAYQKAKQFLDPTWRTVDNDME